jgi:hypothetical protein
MEPRIRIDETFARFASLTSIASRDPIPGALDEIFVGISQDASGNGGTARFSLPTIKRKQQTL